MNQRKQKHPSQKKKKKVQKIASVQKIKQKHYKARRK